MGKGAIEDEITVSNDYPEIIAAAHGNADLIKASGWLGFIAGAEAAYLSCAELCQIAYRRWVLPIGSLAK